MTLTRLPTRRTVSLVAAAWVLALGFDFLLHGGLLAGLYVGEGTFLLPPEAAFARIPAGYLTFLFLTVGLLWLFRRLEVLGWREGAGTGLAVGLYLWATMALGLWSVTTAEVGTLVGWSLGQGVELGLVGAVLGAGRAGAPLRGLWLRVGGAVLAFVVAAVVLQNVGWAPTVQL